MPEPDDDIANVPPPERHLDDPSGRALEPGHPRPLRGDATPLPLLARSKRCELDRYAPVFGAAAVPLRSWRAGGAGGGGRGGNVQEGVRELVVGGRPAGRCWQSYPRSLPSCAGSVRGPLCTAPRHLAPQTKPHLQGHHPWSALDNQGLSPPTKKREATRRGPAAPQRNTRFRPITWGGPCWDGRGCGWGVCSVRPEPVPGPVRGERRRGVRPADLG